ncbi:unnamed protein product, partial [marine sediment metagenome]
MGEGYLDSYNIVISPTSVIPPPPSDWPVVKQAQVFHNVRLSPGVLKEASKSKQKDVDTAVVLGARIDYTVTLEASVLTGCKAWFLWNNEIVGQKEFWVWEPHGTVKSGSVLIPKNRILPTNNLTIILSHVPATFNSCLFNVHVMFGYSQEPSFDPPWREEQPDWVKYL